MRHGNKINALGRKKAHREAMLANMACSLIEHKRINTTVAKAKELRKYVEPLITKSKADSTHSRRVVFSYLKSKDAVTELFREVAPKVAERPGGYVRILKTGRRLGDSAEMCMVELVDFNELMLEAGKPAKSKRSRRGGKKKSSPATAAAAPAAGTATTDAPKADEKSAEAEAAPKAEAKKETEAPKAEAKPEVESKEEKAPEAKAQPEAPKKEAKEEKAPEAEEKKEAPKAEKEPEAKAKEEAPKAEEKNEEPAKEEKKADAPKSEADDSEKKDDQKSDDDQEDKKKNE